jgi:phosphoadenosine phosphosulfate reductase
MFDEYCNVCNKKGRYIGTDIRPVFPEERLLLEILAKKEFEYVEKSIWNTGGNSYIVDGKKIKFSMTDTINNANINYIKAKIEELKSENNEYEGNFFKNQYILKFIKANKVRLNLITSEALQYIKNTAVEYKSDEMFVSFSGGKDSIVTSDLVMKALGKDNIIHIYGDTTLEYPETSLYLNRFKEQHGRTPILIAKNKEQNFNELCKIIGPPSRIMRWCCTIFKTGAITRKIESTFKDKKNILTFFGVRRSESISRNKYDRDSNESKIAKQRAASPIIDWLDFDVWLYILSNNLDFNKAYRLGFARVGCWCCPNNGLWSEFLSSIYMSGEYYKFRSVLINFAKSIEKPDPEEYISGGGWKARQGGNGLDYSKNVIVEVKPCVLIENTFNFDLLTVINDSLYELFKPFGNLNRTIGNQRLNEIYILQRGTNEPILKLSGKIGEKNLKITILKFIGVFKNLKTSEMLIKNQITKYQACISCLACESICKYNSIKIINKNDDKNMEYKIDDKTCIGCLECVKHFLGGCLMRKILRTKIGAAYHGKKN